jgi:AcrR family transcriptional regulator
METTNRMPKKESRKTRYTRQVIRESLIELMETRPVTGITIKEICAVADISRPTFYAHYRDQYDLLRTIEEEISVYFEKIVFIHKAGALTKREIKHEIEEVLHYIENNSNSIQVLLSENGDPGFQKRFFLRYTEYVRDIAKYYLESEAAAGLGIGAGKSAGISELYSVFAVQGLTALVQHWLKNRMNPSKKVVAAMIAKLIWGI